MKNFGIKFKLKFLAPVTAGLGFLLLPAHKAQAFWTSVLSGLTGTVGGAVGKVAGWATIYAVVALFILTFGEFMLNLGNGLIMQAVANPFGFSYTNPGDNPVIALGWPLLRDLTNMLFILGLAYIGLSTALNLANFNTKKAFVNLLIVALLVNFTPIICGVVVDIANLIFNFFLPATDADFNYMVTVYQEQVIAFDQECGTMNKITGGDKSCWGRNFLLGLYGIMGGVLLCVYGILFLVRYVVIWILVILSPLAFFAWSFEKTKGYFHSWWKNFISWSFVVVPASFFLYLSRHMLALARDGKLGGAAPSTVAGPVTTSAVDLFSTLAPYFVCLIFLGFSLNYTKKMGAAGAAGILALATMAKTKGIGLTKKYAGKVGKGVEKYAPGAAGTVATGVAGGVGGMVRGAEKGMEKGGAWGAVKGQIAGGFTGAFTRKGRQEAKKSVLQGLEEARFLPSGYTEKTMKAGYKRSDANKALAEVSDPERVREMIERATMFGAKDETIGVGIEGLIKLANDHDLTDTDVDYALTLKDKKGVSGSDWKDISKALTKSKPELEGVLNPEKVAKVRDNLLVSRTLTYVQAGKSQEEANSLALTDIEGERQERVEKRAKEYAIGGLTPEDAHERAIREEKPLPELKVVMDKIKQTAAEKFRTDVQTDSYQNMGVFLGLDSSKLKDIRDKGNAKQWNELQNMVSSSEKIEKIRKASKSLVDAGLFNDSDKARIMEVLEILGAVGKAVAGQKGRITI